MPVSYWKKSVDLGWRGTEEDLEEVSGGSTIRIHSIKNLFSLFTKHLLIWQRTRVQFPAPTWQLTTCNSSSGRFNTHFLSPQALYTIVHIYSCRQNTHLHKSKWIFKKIPKSKEYKVWWRLIMTVNLMGFRITVEIKRYTCPRIYLDYVIRVGRPALIVDSAIFWAEVMDLIKRRNWAEY